MARSARKQAMRAATGDLAAAHDALVARARTARRHGDLRGAIVALREACMRDESAAWLWTMYGALLVEGRRHDEALRALRHALWLRKSSGDDGRARVTQRLIERLELRDAA